MPDDEKEAIEKELGFINAIRLGIDTSGDEKLCDINLALFIELKLALAERMEHV